ncbi:MAG: phosphonoacetaldehyde hydrolase [Bryobacteraceae bacterium]|nr:phosphonoacetaldehyde hydrolase [Bryobacteraceae bacterium]
MIRAILLDWAGTTVDHGSRAPVAVMLDLFAAHGFAITEQEARVPMGLPKRDHIAAILAMPRVAESYRGPGLDELYADFLPRQLEVLSRHADLIPGVAETVHTWQAAGIKIATSTGYTRPMLDLLVTRAREQGYRPDANFCPDDVDGGRPAPWMAFAAMRALDIYPPNAWVKIGDTPSDIEEGRNAGMWTIGVTDTGNEAGDPSRFIAAGAHYVCSSVAEAPPIVAELGR